MPLDTSIYQNLLRPPKSVADYDAEYQTQQTNALALQNTRQNMLAAQQKAKSEAEMARQGNALSMLRASGVDPTTPEGMQRAYALGPLAAPKFLESQFDLQRKGLDNTGKRTSNAKDDFALGEDKRKAAVQQIVSIGSADEALQLLESKMATGEVPAQLGPAFRSLIASDPKWQLKLTIGVMDPKQMADILTPHLQTNNVGGQTVTQAQDKITGKSTVTGTITNTQSPESMASERSAAASRAQAERHFQAGQANANLPTFDATNGVWVDRKNRTVTPATSADGKLLPGKAVIATEDERKAAGWLAQADNAWKNMRAVGFDANGNIKPAAQPGFNDALAAVPSLGLGGSVANMMRTPERQKFIQASSSLSEALLRAATGAGVNESEARQKVQELTPVWGEDEATTKQKMDAIPMYLGALKDRAGRAAPQGYTPPAVPRASDNKAPALNQDLFNAADAIIRGGK